MTNVPSDPTSPLDAIPQTFNQSFVRGAVKDAMKQAHAGSGDLWKVPIDELKVAPGFNVRIRNDSLTAHIRWIADSIKANGFYIDEPIGAFCVEEDDGTLGIYVHQGHCRLEAARLAKAEGAPIETLPVVVVPKSQNLEDLTVALITTNSGKNLTPYECALVCKRLAGYGWSSSQIATKINFTVSYVDALLDIPGYPIEIRELIHNGLLSVSTAREAMKTYGHRAVEKLLHAAHVAETKGSKRVTNKHLPGKRFESFVKRSGPRLYDATKIVRNDPAYSALSAETREALDTLLDELEKKRLSDEQSLATEQAEHGGSATTGGSDELAS